MFDAQNILPWQRRNTGLVKRRVQSLSLIRNYNSERLPTLHDAAGRLPRDWGFELLPRDRQGVLPLDLPPAA